MAIAAKDSDFSDRSGKTKLKAFWKGFTIVDAMKYIYDSQGEIKASTVTGGKRYIPTLINQCEGFKSSVVEVIADMVETAREVESEVEREDVTELLQSFGTTLLMRRCFL